MSPEYLRTGEITPAADILALGISLIELMSGKKFGRPKLKRSEHEDSVVKLLQTTRFPPKLQSILKQCLSWNPNSRPTAARLEDELYNIAESLSGLSLRRWAAHTIPQLEQNTSPQIDPLRLLGQTIQMNEQSFILDPNTTLDTPAPVDDSAYRSPSTITNISVQQDSATDFGKYATLMGIGMGLVLYLITLPLYLLR